MFFPQLKPSHSIVVLFIITQFLALWSGATLIEASKIIPEVKELSVAPTGNAEDPLNAAFFMAYVIFGAAMVLLVIKFIKGPLIFRILEFFVLIGSVSALFIGILHSLSAMPTEYEFLLSFLFGFVFAAVKFFTPALKNPAAVLSSAGVGALFGFSVGFTPALLFIIGISLYDFAAVFMTKHMLALSSALGTKELSFTVTATMAKKEMPKEIPVHAAKKTSAVKTAAASAKISEETSGEWSGEERLDLGSGDLAVPAVLAVAAYPVAGLAGSLAVIFGSSVALFILLDFVVTRRVALPAMPPISLGALLALLVILLIGA